MEREEQMRAEFSELVRRHGASMFRAARVLLDCDQDAEDAVSEAVLLAWQGYGRLRKPEAARSWLLKICVNCAHSQRRRQSRMIYLEDLEGVAGAVPAEEPSGLWEAVLRLPEDQRMAVLLYYYEDMPVAEIARVLSIPQGTVKSRLHRGRDRLRRSMEEEPYAY